MAGVKEAIYGLVVAGALTAGYTGVVSEGYRDQVTPGERVELRTERMKVFPGATAREGRARVYPELRHWPEVSAKGDTVWREIDLEVKPKPWLRRMVSDKPYEITAGPWTAELSGDRPENYRLEAGGNWIEFEALHDTSGVRATVERTPAGLKETLVLGDEKAGTPAWRVTASGKLLRGDDGAVMVAGTSLRVSAPVAWDAKGAPVAVTASLEENVLRYDVEREGVVWPVTVDPTVTVGVYAAQTGYLTNGNADYLTARNGVTASGIAAAGVWVVGQYTNVADEYIERMFATFPGAPIMAYATSCTLWVNGNWDESTTDFEINLYAARAYGPTLTVEDFPRFSGWAASGAYSATKLNETWDTSGYSADWNAIVFNAAGLDTLEACSGDTLRVALLSSRDVSATAPSGLERVSFVGTGATAPYLSIDFYYPDVHDPGSFRATPIPGAPDSLALAWTIQHTSSIDTLKIGRVVAPGDTAWTILASKTATSARIGGLNPYEKYTLFVRADSLGYYGYSAPDDIWTSTELSRFVVSMGPTVMKSARPANAGDYATARGETDAGDIAAWGNNWSGPHIGQSASATMRITRGSIVIPYPEFADLLHPARACTIQTQTYIDSTATDFSVRMYKHAARGLGTIEALWYQFLGWVAGTETYTGTNLMEDFSTSSLAGALGTNKWAHNATGMDVVNAEIAAGDSLKRALLSSRDIAATEPAGNEFFILTDTNSLIFYGALPDTAAGTVSLTGLTPTSMRVTWNDRAHSERGYIVVDASTGAAVSDTLAANTETVDIAGLDVNTEYAWKIKTLGGGGHGDLSAAATEYTLANTPGMPAITFPADTLLKYVLDANGNPAGTLFAIQDSISGKYIHDLDGRPDTLRTVADWRTAAQWGGASGDTLLVLVGKKYGVRAKAKSGQ